MWIPQKGASLSVGVNYIIVQELLFAVYTESEVLTGGGRAMIAIFRKSL